MASDVTLLDEIKAQITELPTYGYRRACALVNRQRAQAGAPRVNAKRALQAQCIAPIPLAELAVVAGRLPGVGRDVLLPQQHECRQGDPYG